MSPVSQRLLTVLRDPPLDGPTNMARDEHLLYSDAVRPAALRLYAWSPSTISLGFFQRFEDLAHLAPPLSGLAVVRRATGGGAILHDQEITYCLVVDDSVDRARQAPTALYRLVHECWRDVLNAAGWTTRLAPEDWPLHSPRDEAFFCFQRPGRTDLLLRDHKLLGSAQRRIAGRVLQHGSLLLERRFADHPGAALHVGRTAAQPLEDAFIARLSDALHLPAALRDWTADELADAHSRRARFTSEAWMRRR